MNKILILLVLITSCQTVNIDVYMSPFFIVKSVKKHEGELLYTSYNGKLLITDEIYSVGDTIK